MCPLSRKVYIHTCITSITMDDAIISVRINKELRDKMKSQEEVNWSAVLRRAIIENIERGKKVNLERRKKAIAMMDKLRKEGAFDGGRNSTEIIREWRDKRH